MAAESKAFLSGYFQSLTDEKAKERYKVKLDSIGGVESYEIPRKEWVIASVNTSGRGSTPLPFKVP